MLDELATNVPDLHVALTNGTHVESLGPDLLVSVFEFLDFYVAERIPQISPVARPAAPGALQPDLRRGVQHRPRPDLAAGLRHRARPVPGRARHPGAVGAGRQGVRRRRLHRWTTPSGPACVAPHAAGPLRVDLHGVAAADRHRPGALPRPRRPPRRRPPRPSPTTRSGAGPRTPTTPPRSARSARSPGTTGRDLARPTRRLQLAQPARGRARQLHHRPAGVEPQHPRLRQRRPLAAVDRARRRRRGHALRGPPRRPGDLHPGRLAAGLAPPRGRGLHRARPVPRPPRRRRPRRCPPASSPGCGSSSSRSPTSCGPGSRLRLTVDAPGGSRPFWKFHVARGPRRDQRHRPLRRPPVAPDPVDGARPRRPGGPARRASRCGASPAGTFTGLRSPTDVTAELDADARTVDVGWTAPESGGTVTGYTVTVLPTGETFDGRRRARRPSPTTSATARRRPRQLAYRVTASFAGGDGPPSSPSLEVPGPTTSPTWPTTPGTSTPSTGSTATTSPPGFDDGTFRPGRPVTRQQMVRWLWVTMGRPRRDHEHPYTDVADGSWADAALDWADEQDIVFGFPDGTFRPRAPDHPGPAQRLAVEAGRRPDGHHGQRLHRRARRRLVRATASTGWSSTTSSTGFSDDTFRPNDRATRGQMANWLYLTVGRGGRLGLSPPASRR